MKHILLFLLLIVVLMIPCYVCAEGENYSLEGEWYLCPIDTENGSEAEVDEDGNFVLNIDSNDTNRTVFYTDGKVHNKNGDIIITKREELSPDSVVYLADYNGFYGGYLFIREGNVWKGYNMDAGLDRILMINGKVYTYQVAIDTKNDLADVNRAYYIAGDKLYWIIGNTYMAVTLKQLGEKAYCCIMNIDSKGKFQLGESYYLNKLVGILISTDVFE